MMTAVFSIHRFIAAVFVVSATATPLLAQDADILDNWTGARTPGQRGESKVDVTGTWSFQVETDAGTGTPTMTFKQEGEKLSGHYSGQLGEAPLTGTVKGNAVEFTIDVSFQGTQLHVVYSGTVEKDSMKGSVKLGDIAEGTFTAKKKS